MNSTVLCVLNYITTVVWQDKLYLKKYSLKKWELFHRSPCVSFFFFKKTTWHSWKCSSAQHSVCSEVDAPNIFIHSRATPHAPVNWENGSSRSSWQMGDTWMESAACIAASWSNWHSSAYAAPLPWSSHQLLYQHSSAAGCVTDRPWHRSSTWTAFGLLFELRLALEESGGLYYSRSQISK